MVPHPKKEVKNAETSFLIIEIIFIQKWAFRVLQLLKQLDLKGN